VASDHDAGMTKQLDGKVALITGGGGGIGSVFGRALAEQGAAVVLGDLNLERASEVVADITAAGLSAKAVRLDVTDPASAAAAVQAAVDSFGGLDLLVNSAALMAEVPFTPLASFPLDWWDRVLAVNLKGPFVCTQAAVPAMSARGGGRIVNMVSAGAFQPSGMYGISKYALVGLTMNFAAQLGAIGITVNAIAPGLVANDSGYAALPAGDAREMMRRLVPLKTHVEGPPEDLVGTLLLLLSESGAWITGQTISVDGGWIMRF
jgi:NAD(P)-dependent dehydrogenase (short-subunit alcohol dehydrogenase family)